VLDELDKLEANMVFEIMKYYKNLFTLSSAIFVFVGGEEIFKQYQINGGDDDSYYSRNQPKDYRPLKYTYFTSKYFLARPNDTDLLNFLDEIAVNSRELVNDPYYEFFKRAIILDANCDYFDIIQIIKGRINGFEGIRPVLNEENNEETKNKAKLQQSLSVVFSNKYAFNHPSNGRKMKLY
jgi:hypothetical protein